MKYRSITDIQTATRTAIVLAVISLFACCIREPELHLFDAGDVNVSLPEIQLELDVYWDYETAYGLQYDWRKEWYYGWDETDEELFGKIGYSTPDIFMLRRYFTDFEPYGPHTSVLANTVKGYVYKGKFNWGFWDILVWNDIETPDGVQSLLFDEQTTLDYVTAYTNQTMFSTRYEAPRYTHSFYQPEDLFSAYERGIEIDRGLKGFEYDPVSDVYIKKLSMVLEPITYIYLTQLILHHNRNRVVNTDGMGNLTGFGRTTVINTGIAGDDAISVHYQNRFKANCLKEDEVVDIIGGRLMTFGICGQNANRIKRRADVNDTVRHYLDMNLQFNNGMDSTFVFDVTEQVRRRWKGGVITVELDLDSVSIPTRRGGSAFNAVVKDYEDGGTHEFPL